MSTSPVAPFPWQRIPSISRTELSARRELCERLDRALDPTALGQALAELLGADARADGLSFELRSTTASTAVSATATLHFPGHGLRLCVAPEPDLLRACVARLLEQDFELGWADAGVDPPLRGAGAALVLELARRAARTEAPDFVACPESFDGAASPRLGAALSVWLGDEPYRLDLVLEALPERPPLAQKRGASSARLRRLGDLELRVPWVSALSSASVDVLEALAPGDVWVPGARSWLGGDASPSSGVLAAPRAERGMPVRVSGGRIVLGADPVRLHQELEASMGQEDSELEQIVGETPVVVRLEIGSLELSAADWAALRPGDVVQSGRRIEEGVILRAAGREIARGELVDIEGEIGVRITQVGAQRAPA